MVQCFRISFSFYSGSPGIEAGPVVDFYKSNFINSYRRQLWQ